MTVKELLKLRNKEFETEYNIEIGSKIVMKQSSIMIIAAKYCEGLSPIILDAEIESWNITTYDGIASLQIWVTEKTYNDIMYSLSEVIK